MAIEVMKEIGIDISGHRSKLIDEFFGKGIDGCHRMRLEQKVCPFLPGTRRNSPGFSGSLGIHRN